MINWFRHTIQHGVLPQRTSHSLQPHRSTYLFPQHSCSYSLSKTPMNHTHKQQGLQTTSSTPRQTFWHTAKTRGVQVWGCKNPGRTPKITLTAPCTLSTPAAPCTILYCPKARASMLGWLDIGGLVGDLDSPAFVGDEASGAAAPAHGST
jgi:hypothetical protein